MYRDKITELEKWQTSKERKPLVIHGARQVGKTWLAREFGKANYAKIAYIDLLNKNARVAQQRSSLQASVGGKSLLIPTLLNSSKWTTRTVRY